MTVSCVISGIAGAFIPLALKRLGADPATASSIFLTTATDVVSMGVFLSLATAFLLWRPLRAARETGLWQAASERRKFPRSRPSRGPPGGNA